LRSLSLRVASFLAVFTVATAHAHLAPPLVRADRTLTVTLGERVTLAYVVRLSNPELSRVRREGDLDRDGTLSRGESDRVLATFTTALHEGVRYSSGRAALGPSGRLAAAFAMATEATGLEGPVELPEQGPGARLAWQFDLRLSRDDHRLAIEDSATFVQFDHSDVVVRDSATRTLTGLGDDPSRMGLAPQLSWVDAGAGHRHSIHVTWTPARDDGRGWVVMLVIAAGLAIAAATLWSVRGSAAKYVDRQRGGREDEREGD
jgi:hypothetical protein